MFSLCYSLQIYWTFGALGAGISVYFMETAGLFVFGEGMLVHTGSNFRPLQRLLIVNFYICFRKLWSCAIHYCGIAFVWDQMKYFSTVSNLSAILIHQ